METVLTKIVYKMEGGDAVRDVPQCVAFMPGIEGSPGCITCYSHVGQHASAVPEYMDSLPDATLEQSADLRAELERIGYVEKYDISDLKREYRIASDPGDPWGSVMSWWFSVADMLHWVHETDIPTDWQFVPGMAEPDMSENPEVEVLEHCDAETLTEFGNLLCRVADILKRKGMDY